MLISMEVAQQLLCGLQLCTAHYLCSGSSLYHGRANAQVLDM